MPLALGHFCFCGEAGRSVRLAYRICTPQALLDEGRRCVIRGGGKRLTSLQWHQAKLGSVIVRTRDDAWGTRAGVGAGGDAVALMVESLSGYPTLPERAPPVVVSVW